MSKIRIIFTALTIIGIAGLAVVGAQGTINNLLPIGIAIGTGISSIISLIKKDK